MPVMPKSDACMRPLSSALFIVHDRSQIYRVLLLTRRTILGSLLHPTRKRYAWLPREKTTPKLPLAKQNGGDNNSKPKGRTVRSKREASIFLLVSSAQQVGAPAAPWEIVTRLLPPLALFHYMAEHKIEPDKIKSPIQLLAAWFVALVLVDGAFLTAAGVVASPTWLPAVLVIAAVLNVPVFLCCMFLLQTRFRPEMLSDLHYAEYLKRNEQAQDLASQVRDQMDKAGVALADLVLGRRMNAVAVEQLRPLVEKLNHSIRSLQHQRKREIEVDPESLRALAHGELGVGNWLRAAKTLDEYAKYQPDDFEANFSRGVAYANARDGHKTNVGALRAYNDAVATMPENLDANARARLFTYRGAMLKRMHRFEEALADFHVSESLATSEYEVADLLYNLASVYAMMGDRDKMMAVIRRIPRGSNVWDAIRARLTDYFSAFAADEEFLQLIEFGHG